MTRTEISQAIVATNRFNIGHMTLAAGVASCCEIYLEGFHILWRVVVVRDRCARHFDVITTEEEQERVARETNDIRDEHELNCAFGFELESLEEEAADEDADTCAGYCDRAGKDARLTLAQAELRLEIFREKHDEAADNHQLHARAETRYNVNWVRYQTPH